MTEVKIKNGEKDISLQKTADELALYDLISTSTTGGGYLSTCAPTKSVEAKTIFAGAITLFACGNVDAASTEQSFMCLNESEDCEAVVDNYRKHVEEPHSYYVHELFQRVASKRWQKHELVRKIVSFESLRDGWDGYGAVPLEVESAANAISFLDLLDKSTLQQLDEVSPDPHGTVSFLWVNSGQERVSLEIGNKGYSYYVKFNSLEPIFGKGETVSRVLAREIDAFVGVL